MKKHITLTTLALLVATIGFSQNDTSEVIISPQKGKDSTIVRIGKMKVIVLDGDDEEDGNSKDEIIVDREVGKDTLNRKRKHKPINHWASFEIGIDGFLHNDGLGMPAGKEYLELDYSRNIGVSLNFWEKDFRLIGNHVELVTGMGIQLTNFTFESEFSTLTKGATLGAITDSSKVLEKNRLKVFYLNAPLMLGFSTHEDQDKAFRLAAGGVVGWRIGSRLKQKYSFEGETYKPKVKSDYHLNPFLFKAAVSVGYGDVGIFATYALNSLFEDNKEIELTPFHVGLQFIF